MVVGESGLGKSTLIDSLFLAELYSERRVPMVEDRIEKTVKIEKKVSNKRATKGGEGRSCTLNDKSGKQR